MGYDWKLIKSIVFNCEKYENEIMESIDNGCSFPSRKEQYLFD